MTASLPNAPHLALNADFWLSRLSARSRAMSASAIREILKITQQPDVISFAGGLPAPELFPLQDISAAYQRVIEKYGPAAMQYSTTEGHLPLREWIASRSHIPASNVQIMTGSQQGLDLLGKVLISEGDVVLVESPTYLGALQSFQPYLPRYVQVPTDEHGIDVDALATVLQSAPAKVLYCVPNFQNPTGRTLSLERRQQLLNLTREHGVLVLEDDPYGQLRFSGEAVPNLYDLALAQAGGDPEQVHVIYSGSFSKVLVPGLRDAWVQAASPIINKLIQAKQGADLHTPTLNQMLIAELVDDVLPRQIEVVKRAYGERAQHMLKHMQAHFPAGAKWTTPQGGMFLWVTLPQGVNTTELLPSAVARKVAYVPGNPFFALGGGENTLRMSYSSATPEQIERGIAALGQTLQEALA